MTVVGLTGIKPGQMDGLAQVVIHAPGEDTAAVQELHLPVYHALCAGVEQALFA